MTRCGPPPAAPEAAAPALPPDAAAPAPPPKPARARARAGTKAVTKHTAYNGTAKREAVRARWIRKRGGLKAERERVRLAMQRKRAAAR